MRKVYCDVCKREIIIGELWLTSHTGLDLCSKCEDAEIKEEIENGKETEE